MMKMMFEPMQTKSSSKYKDYSREQLVEEYLETSLASLVNFCGVDRRWMPKDVSRDPITGKPKTKTCMTCIMKLQDDIISREMTVFGLKTRLTALIYMSLTISSRLL